MQRTIVDVVIAFELKFVVAIRLRDVEACKGLTADDFCSMSAASGQLRTLSRSKWLTELRCGRVQPYDVYDLQVRVYAQSAAITMLCREQIEEHSGVEDIQVLITDIWTKRGRWQLSERQVSYLR